jgi:hypothetical protein
VLRRGLKPVAGHGTDPLTKNLPSLKPSWWGIWLCPKNTEPATSVFTSTVAISACTLTVVVLHRPVVLLFRNVAHDHTKTLKVAYSCRCEGHRLLEIGRFDHRGDNSPIQFFALIHLQYIYISVCVCVYSGKGIISFYLASLRFRLNHNSNTRNGNGNGLYCTVVYRTRTIHNWSTVEA